jgi:hypothetical protein
MSIEKTRSNAREDRAEVDVDERMWLRAAAMNEAFDFLTDPREDIYTLSDGKLFRDESSQPHRDFKN